MVSCVRSGVPLNSLLDEALNVHKQKCTVTIMGHGYLCCRKSVVCPIIDVISDESFEYITGSDMTWGGFNWKLNFRWYPVPQREVERRGGDRSLPLRCFLSRIECDACALIKVECR